MAAKTKLTKQEELIVAALRKAGITDWFFPHDGLSDAFLHESNKDDRWSTKRAEWRCERMLDAGALERRINPNINRNSIVAMKNTRWVRYWQYRVKQKNNNG